MKKLMRSDNIWWSDEVKNKNANELDDSRYVYKLRGTPKNGLQVKRFLKRVQN